MQTACFCRSRGFTGVGKGSGGRRGQFFFHLKVMFHFALGRAAASHLAVRITQRAVEGDLAIFRMEMAAVFGLVNRYGRGICLVRCTMER